MTDPKTTPFGTVALSEWLIMALASVLMIAASWWHWWALPMTEVFGFVSGGICVWLVVREHVWNWPVGVANNIFFFALFLKSRLFADMGLQLIYLGLGIYGWLNWIYGGTHRTQLKISRTTRQEWLMLGLAIPLATVGLRWLLININGAAPFWDAVTTVISLAAQYLLCRKRFENWFLWIAADVVYIPLYFSRGLVLTGVLYAVFLAMCLVGVREWMKEVRSLPDGMKEATP